MRWLTGHTRDVRAAAFTPDGRLVSGGSDKTVRVWDPVSGECLVTVRAKSPVYAAAAHPDGRTIAYAGRAAPRAASNFVHTCDPAGRPAGRYEIRTEQTVVELIPGTFQFQAVVRPVPRSVWSLAFSADGRYLAAACRQPGAGGDLDGGGGRVWELGPPNATDLPLGEDAYAVAFAPAGHRLAVTRSGAVQFSHGPASAVEYRTPGEWAAAVAFVPAAHLAVIAANSFLLFVDPTRQGKATRVKTGCRVVTGLAVSPDGKTLLAGGRSGTVEVYDPVARTRRTTYDFELGAVHGVAFAPDGLTFAAAGDNGLVVCDLGG